VLGVQGGTAYCRGGIGTGDVQLVLLEQEAVERRERGEPPAGGRRRGAAAEQAREVEIDLNSPGTQRVDAVRRAPALPGP
jgi:hypothetical protein